MTASPDMPDGKPMGCGDRRQSSSETLASQANERMAAIDPTRVAVAQPCRKGGAGGHRGVAPWWRTCSQTVAEYGRECPACYRLRRDGLRSPSPKALPVARRQ